MWWPLPTTQTNCTSDGMRTFARVFRYILRFFSVRQSTNTCWFFITVRWADGGWPHAQAKAMNEDDGPTLAGRTSDPTVFRHRLDLLEARIERRLIGEQHRAQQNDSHGSSTGYCFRVEAHGPGHAAWACDI